jgi:phosphopantetheinyl transferase
MLVKLFDDANTFANVSLFADSGECSDECNNGRGGEYDGEYSCKYGGEYGNLYLRVASISETLAKDVNFLPQQEQQRYRQYKNRNAADLFLLGRILLRRILYEKYMFPFDVDIKIDANGKPYIPQKSSPYFNISHSNEKVAIAFAEKPIGVDMEKFVKHSRETLLAMGQKVFSSKEMLLLENAANIQECFTTLWVITEAFVKATGRGLAYSSEIDLSGIYAVGGSVSVGGVDGFGDIVDVGANIINEYRCFTERISNDYFLSVTVEL